MGQPMLTSTAAGHRAVFGGELYEDFRSLCHGFRLASEKLDRTGHLIRTDPSERRRFFVAVAKRLGRYHFRCHIVGAVSFTDAPERRIAHTRHGRKPNGARMFPFRLGFFYTYILV